jgi:hypothetical protein
VATKISRSANERMDRATKSERFKQMARELGSDEDEAAFREKLRVIAKQKPKDEPKKKAAKG